MAQTHLCKTTKSPEETARLARRVGALLSPGDCLLLSGTIGAGKTHFARHLVQSRLKTPEDVPSPTFTLVQTYETDAGEIWHADLYRLTRLDEVEELGLNEAFDAAICLVEWPDKLGGTAPENALSILFETQPVERDHRKITLHWENPKWIQKLEPLTHD